MPEKIISAKAIERRSHWVEEIVKISGRFGEDTSRIEAELAAEVKKDGPGAIVDHLRLCGSIPERYGHDTSEEKLYSKYTDALLATAYRQLGLTALVLAERADAADVEAVAKKYALVADAKAFRLSRTAKNQKDFKTEALHHWKRGKPHAMVVCPIYQLPTRSSQIYQQALVRNVCIFSYSHLAVLVRFAVAKGTEVADELLLRILKCAEAMNADKDAVAYWTNLNRTMLAFDKSIAALWQVEKLANTEAIGIAKDEALTFLAKEREQIMRMSHQEAINQLIRNRNIDGREKVIKALEDNGILTIS